MSGKTRAQLLGIEAKKDQNFSEWYTQVVTRAELLDYYDISGCFILRPSSYCIWEQIQHFFDAEIKKLGVKNAYFPLLVSERALNAEKDHIADFSPEVAWVTRCGQSDLAEPVAIRPTSETIMYPAYARWIQSHRDLPLKLNQWSNVVRWEFKDAVPFIRSREFLWQEGHSAFATQDEAGEEVLQILELYRRVYEELLAVPVVKGHKSDKEKFAGGLYTTTVEAFIPGNGRAVQGATSHCLGQNFSKMFHIEFENSKGGKSLVWQNSWGITTRTIGVVTMVHGDDTGLVLPPRVAPVQVVVIPLHFKGSTEAVDAKAAEIAAQLRAEGLRVELDDRPGYKPGFKYNHWEMRGVCIRIELGPRDLEAGKVVLCRRDNRAKETVDIANLVEAIKSTLDNVHDSMFAKAKAALDDGTAKIDRWADFVPSLNQKKICRVPWCRQTACEEVIKAKSAEESVAAAASASADSNASKLSGAAKSLCIPIDQSDFVAGSKCFACGADAQVLTLFGRSY